MAEQPCGCRKECFHRKYPDLQPQRECRKTDPTHGHQEGDFRSEILDYMGDRDDNT